MFHIGKILHSVNSFIPNYTLIWQVKKITKTKIKIEL